MGTIPFGDVLHNHILETMGDSLARLMEDRTKCVVILRTMAGVSREEAESFVDQVIDGAVAHLRTTAAEVADEVYGEIAATPWIVKAVKELHAKIGV